MSSNSLNTCALSGNLGNDADVRYTSGGMAITSFSLAVNRSKKQQDGSYTDEVSWVDCKMFGKRGESLQANGYLQKGAKVAIIGHLRMSAWESEGQRHRKLEVIVDNIVGMTNYRQPQQPQAQPPYQPPQDYAPQDCSAGVYDEDIPF